jgi:hypothetical protein
LNSIKDKVYLKILEDCADPRLVSNESLVQACRLFEEFSYDSDNTRTIKDVYQQVVKRGHFLSQLQISQIDHSFNRLQKLSLLKFLPEVKKDIKNRIQSVNVNDLVAEELNINDKTTKMHFNPESERLTLHMKGVRYVLQNIKNYGLSDMHKVINAFSKEKFDAVMLTQPPLRQNSILTTQDQISSELAAYLNVKKRFKAGDVERVVYEKVNGLR